MDLLSYERRFFESGKKYISGTDEAGRGPLAGPVVVASVIMPPDEPMIEGVFDSKQVSEKLREILFDKILDRALCFAIEAVDEKVIDEINILNATKLGMVNSIKRLAIKPDAALVDAVKIDAGTEVVPIVKGDTLSYSIAAASILAKVYRDRLMRRYDDEFPVYKFAQHKGYATRQHIELIKRNGICRLHRKTFVKNFYAEQN